MLDVLKYRITNLKEIENKLKDQKTNSWTHPTTKLPININYKRIDLFQVTTKERPKLIQSTKANDIFIEENATLLLLIQEN